MKDMNPGSQLTSIRDIVIMGNISAGARAIATGNITVMGKIEGFVHAGANGNDRAYIVGNCLCPKVYKLPII
ncbi:MAG: septum site-determining protein MinC [Paeniclostridium sp.]